MIDQLRITVLVENTVGLPGLLGEHGLSFWIEADERPLLFDTGQGLALAHNADQLGIDLARAEAVVLSHGHYDHTGGLAASLRRFSNAKVHAHPAAFDPKYGKWPGRPAREIGAPCRDIEQIRESVGALELSAESTEILPDIHTTGEVPRRTDFEDTGGPFFLDPEGQTPDRLLDDQALWLRTGQGIVVLLGCAHSGLVNTLDTVKRLSGDEEIHAVLGGMHLLTASQDRLDKSADALQLHGVSVIGPAHCTGRAATIFLWKRFPDRCVECMAGSRFEF